MRLFCETVIALSVIFSPILTQMIKKKIPRTLVPFLNPILTSLLAVIPVWLSGNCEILLTAQWSVSLGALASLFVKSLKEYYHEEEKGRR